MMELDIVSNITRQNDLGFTTDQTELISHKILHSKAVAFTSFNLIFSCNNGVIR
jgi:hypothetical protein